MTDQTNPFDDRAWELSQPRDSTRGSIPKIPDAPDTRHAEAARESRPGMKATELMNLLRTLRACEKARAWASGKDLAQVWGECERGDWLLWLCGKMADKEGWPTRQELVLAACACAERALKYVPDGVPDGEERPRLAIETARRWAQGQATIEEVRKAAYAAALAAAYAYAYAYDADYDATVTVAAVYAAGAVTVATDAAVTGTVSPKEAADIVRAMLYVPGEASQRREGEVNE